MTGRVYLERGQPVTMLVAWRRPAARGVPCNVLAGRADGTLVVRPFRGLRKRKAAS